MMKRYRPLAFLSVALVFCLSWPEALIAKSPKPIPFHLQQKSAGKALSPEAFSKAVESFLFEKSNQAREGKKLPDLSSEEILERAARDHSRDMLQRSLGENLHTISSSQGLVDPEAVADQMMEDWLHSPSHRKNILSRQYAFLGVGCASDGRSIFCTQVFAGAPGK